MQCTVIKVSIIAAAEMTDRFSPAQFQTTSINKHARGKAVMRVLASAFNAVDSGMAVEKYLKDNPLPNAKRIFSLGLGKAASAMTQAFADRENLTEALVITKHASPLDFEPVTVILGDHPIPGDSSLRAGNAAFNFLSHLTKDDLLVCLISGGGSALMTAPLVPLDDLKKLTSALLKSGARIDEINTLRRHLDFLKGGGIAQHAHGARIISLLLSDVVGDPLEAIASGPTAPDPTTRVEALSIIEKHGLIDKIPASIIPALRETAKNTDPIFERVRNILVGSNAIALNAARSQLELEGFHAKIINSNLQGEARAIGRDLATQLKTRAEDDLSRPFCLLAGGETTVTVTGNGKGGRNQELALGAVDVLAGFPDVMLISIATDGEDGPTDAAGAVIIGETAQRAESLGLSAAVHLSKNDAYPYFAKLNDLIKTGPSGTNVNDLVLCFAF